MKIITKDNVRKEYRNLCRIQKKMFYTFCRIHCDKKKPHGCFKCETGDIMMAIGHQADRLVKLFAITQPTRLGGEGER